MITTKFIHRLSTLKNLFMTVHYHACLVKLSCTNILMVRSQNEAILSVFAVEFIANTCKNDLVIIFSKNC